jgi:hypothetical protein
MSMRLPIGFLLTFMLFAVARGADAPDLTPVRDWIFHASKLKSVEAEFIQERFLKTLNRPLINPGRLWFKAPGSVRWQIGDPPKTIAVQAAKEQDFFVLEPREKVARQFPLKGSSPKRNQILTFLEAGFPQTIEEFQQRFRIDSVRRVGDGTFQISGQIADRRAATAILKVLFVIHETSHQLRRLEVWFRDGSKVINKFQKVTENASVPGSVFQIDLAGYRIEREE